MLDLDSKQQGLSHDQLEFLKTKDNTLYKMIKSQKVMRFSGSRSKDQSFGFKNRTCSILSVALDIVVMDLVNKFRALIIANP